MAINSYINSVLFRIAYFKKYLVSIRLESISGITIE